MRPFKLASQILILALAPLFGRCIPVATGMSAGAGSVYPSIYGTNFTLSVPNVEYGQYTAVLGFVETEFAGPGQRVFDIEYNGQVVARNVDVFAEAGAYKPFFLSFNVRRGSDIDEGPLAFQFISRKQ